MELMFGAKVLVNPLTRIIDNFMANSKCTGIRKLTLFFCHGLVFKADNSQSRGCGFEPWCRILDGIQVKNKKIKVAKWGKPKKFKKT